MGVAHHRIVAEGQVARSLFRRSTRSQPNRRNEGASADDPVRRRTGGRSACAARKRWDDTREPPERVQRAVNRATASLESTARLRAGKRLHQQVKTSS